jgi:TolB-like protein/Flp pilus assembly protein TadD
MLESVEELGHFYEFDSFRLDVIRRLLWRDGTHVPLTPKAFDLILALVQHHGAVLDKDELMRLLWPNLTVEENNLTVIISSLRKALCESPEEHKYVVTIPKRGYCFVAQVSEVWGTKAINPSNALSELHKGGDTVDDLSQPPSLIKRISVLPFRTISTVPNEDYLGIGISEALITKLGSIRQIIVRSNSSVVSQTGVRQDPLQMGKKLGIDFFLEGWVQKADNRIRVTIQMIDVNDGSSVWSGKFDALFTDIFEVQDTISEQVTRALMLRLSGEERKQLTKRHTENSEAYRAYLKGRYFWNKRLVDDLERACEHFRLATEIDPDYALAYVGLADCYNMLSFFSGFSPKEFYPRAREAVARARELDDESAEAHASLALVEMMSDWNWEAAEEGFKHAIKLNPTYTPARQWYAKLLTALGRHEEALAQIRQAQNLDPLSLIIGAIVGFVYYFARQYDEVIYHSRKNLELDPHFTLTYWDLGWAYQQKEMFDEAIATFKKAVSLSGGGTKMVSELGYTYAVSGRKTEADTELKKLLRLSKKHYVSPYEIALIYVGLGANDEALIWLEKAIEDRAWESITLEVEPKLDCLRSEPRFTELLRRIGRGVRRSAVVGT